MRDDTLELLAPHARRKLRAFMVAPDPGNHSTTDVYDALWDLIYSDHPAVSYETARAVEAELKVSDRKVQDVIDGWRPAALTAPSEAGPGSHFPLATKTPGPASNLARKRQ